MASHEHQSADDEFLAGLEIGTCETCHPSPEARAVRDAATRKRAKALMSYFESTVHPSLQPRGGVNPDDLDYFSQLGETRGD